jgi:hypothetical protein
MTFTSKEIIKYIKGINDTDANTLRAFVATNKKSFPMSAKKLDTALPENGYLYSLKYKKDSSMLEFDCTKSAAGLSAHEKLAYNLACTQEEALASEITNYALCTNAI